MATRSYCCFKGRGELSLAEAVAYATRAIGLQKVGNASAIEVNVTETTEIVKDYTTPAGGTHCNFREINELQGKFTLHCHTPKNLIRGLYGAGADEGIASAVVVAEPQVLHLGSIIPLNHLIDESVAPVVKAAGAATVYVAGTDYIVTPGGSIEHVATGSIPAPTVTAGTGAPNIEVSYTRKVQSQIQLAAAISPSQFLHFDGFNVAATPQYAMQFDLFKVRLSTGATLQLVGDNLSKLDFTFTAERDFARPVGTLSNPLSQYGTLKL